MIVYGKVMRVMDRVLVKERSMLGEYQALGIKASWFDQACPRSMPACEHREAPEWDVLILGTISYPDRYTDARILASEGFRVLWAAPADSITIPERCDWHPWVHPLNGLSALVSRCATVLGVDWRSDVAGYTSDRSYFMAGMGAAYVARYVDYGAEFSPWANSRAAELAAWIYHDHDSLVAVMREALKDRDERERRGQALRAKVMGQHTYHHRAADLCRVIGEVQGERLAKAAGAVS